MRSLTAPETSVLTGAIRRLVSKLEIKDAAGVYQDWVSYATDLSWSASVDQPIAEARISLRRDNGTTASLSPFRGDSTLNVGGSAIDSGRDIRISPATVARGSTPVAGDYKPLFLGKTARLDFGEPNMQVLARDQGGTLVRAQIKEESTFESEAGEPLEDVLQDLLDAWAPSVTLYTPVSPGFTVTSIKWGRGSLFEAMRTAVGEIGWDIRYLWDDGTSSFRLTLFEPDRTKTAPDWTYAKNRVQVRQLSIDPDSIRNNIDVSYLDAASGNRLTVNRNDPTSIARFGEQWMLIELADDNPISTDGEATALAEAALADLAWPIAEMSVEVPFFWPVELGDLIRFTANDVHMDDDIDLAVTGYSHSITTTQARTVIAVRGKPAGFYRHWLKPVERSPVEKENDLALKNFREISRSATHVTYGWERGAKVDTVFIYDSLVEEPLPSDPWPTASSTPSAILTAGTDTYDVLIPKAGFISVVQAEGRSTALKSGPARRVLVHAPPPVVNAVLDAFEFGTVIDLSLQVRATASAFPVTATVYEGSKTGLVLTVHEFLADGTITKTDDADLGGRAPPLEDKKFWYAKLVDVSGNEVWVQDSIAAPQKPIIDQIRQMPGSSKEFVDLYVKVTDPLGRGGTLKAWLNRAGSTSPDPTSPADYTIAIASTPEIIEPSDDWTPLGGGATVEALNEVRIHGGNGKQVFFEFVLANGVSSGIKNETLKTWLEIIGEDGELDSGAIKLASQFAASIQPPEIVAVLPFPMPHADYPVGRLVVRTTDGKLYRSTGTGWTAAVDGADIIANSIIAGKLAAGAISTSALFVAGVVDALAIDTNAVTAAKIAAGAITAGKIAAGEITADKMASLVGGGLTIDFSASGTDPVLDHAGFSLLANGDAVFAGEVQSEEFTAGIAHFHGQMHVGDNVSGPYLQVTSNQLTAWQTFGGTIDWQISVSGGDMNISAAGDINFASTVKLNGKVISEDVADSGGTGFRRLITPN